MNETTWDNNTTTWDRDWDGPGTRTIWDLLPSELKIDGLARVLPSMWKAVTTPSRWIGRATR